MAIKTSGIKIGAKAAPKPAEEEAPSKQEDVQVQVATPAPEPAPEPAPAMQETPKAEVPAVASGGGMTAASDQSPAVLGDVSQDGDSLEDEIGFGSFDIVKLDKDVFVCGNEEFPEFNAIILTHRAKWLYKSARKDAEFIFYTYDEQTTTKGDSVASTVAEWEAAGYKDHMKSKYFECQAMIVSETGDLKGKLVLLSVPPASVKKLAGFKKTQSLLRGVKSLREIVTKCSKGARTEVRSGETFYPWKFSYVGPVTDEILEGIHPD